MTPGQGVLSGRERRKRLMPDDPPSCGRLAGFL